MQYKSLLIFISIIFIIQCNSQKQEIRFLEVKKINPNIVLDLRYATESNFLKEKVYPLAKCYVVEIAAFKLDSVQKDLEKQNLGLKIFDGYRPLSVQKKMWQILPDSRYVANPETGSRHNRGAAVDVSLVDSSGKELKMPTDFDDFTDKASHSYMDLPEEVLKNRELLKSTMEKYGFTPIKSEWWHYDLKNYQKYPVVDLSFEEIEKMNK